MGEKERRGRKEFREGSERGGEGEEGSERGGEEEEGQPTFSSIFSRGWQQPMEAKTCGEKGRTHVRVRDSKKSSCVRETRRGLEVGRENERGQRERGRGSEEGGEWGE
eukprot:765633-Hanusia_phi.AAC.3